MKRLLIGFGAVATGLALLPMLAAFEAHVINVTATIENALTVPTSQITFGTVFPQEQLNKPLEVRLSNSFMEENRVDDVDYFIRQKPKCGITTNAGTVLVEGSTVTGHVFPGQNPADPTHTYYQGADYYVDCGVTPALVTGQTFGMLPMLCPYISKHPDGVPVNDGSLNSFHQPFVVNQTGNGPVIDWNDTDGHLAKSQQDTVDNWTIDLAVPCFGGYCAQDWEDFVRRVSGDQTINPSLYVQPEDNEHKVFGCDLWIEIGRISLPGLGCKGKIDLMLVVDESGSIGDANMALVRTALHSFIDTLVLATDGPNAGQTSFATVGVLNQQLTDSPAAMHTAIDTLDSSGFTNLSAGIALANDEFNSARDRVDAPNIMLVVTDGHPNRCYIAGCANSAVEAASYAAAARADGTEIYVVGIGSSVNATYLTNDIASPAPPTHYFAGEFGTIEDTLVDLVTCKP